MVNQTISHYSIQEHICNGGFGEIYRAEDKNLKRQVALKLLPQSMSHNPEIKTRFIYEAQAVSTLDHNNICTIYEVGETEEKQLFIAMAYYKGHTLKKIIEKKTLKIEEIIDITCQIAKGLARAHKAQIIHRDIKPANIIITEDNEVKILDFGIAKCSNQSMQNHQDCIMGTMAYMSPEQLQNNNIDHRSDIWSLGVVLYEMITGKLPFKGEYEQSIAYEILNKEPDLISVFKSNIPISLKWILEKTLAKEPDHRYQHIDEIPVDLKVLQSKNQAISEIMVNSKDFKKRTRRIEGLLLFCTAGIVSLLIFIFFNLLK